LGGAANAAPAVKPLDSAVAVAPEVEINCLRFIVGLQPITAELADPSIVAVFQSKGADDIPSDPRTFQAMLRLLF
jgi:hypothetical protein